MSRPRLLPTAALALALLLGLALTDVLPGGWRLRGWLEPHAVRSARAQAGERARRLLEFARERPPEGAVLFLGSSTVARWPLAECFPGVPCTDRGVPGESLLELCDRLEPSLPAARPAGAVLYLASIDVRERAHPPERIAEAARWVLAALRERWPELPVVLIGVLPERDMSAELGRRLAATNAALAALCAREACTFLPTDRAPITGPGGSLAPELAADRLHLAPAGYRVLSGWLLREGGEVGRRLGGE